MHGAQVIMVRGNFDDCLRISRELAEHYPVALVNSVNPIRLEGQKTASFEIVDFLGDAPDVHVLPVGNAGNISAYWKGYVEYAEAGVATRTPQMLGWQAAGAAPLVARRAGAAPGDGRLGDPHRQPGLLAPRGRGGQRAPAAASGAVTDEEILAAQRELAANEGVFVEPASAAGVAGLLKDVGRQAVVRGQDASWSP